MQFNAKHNGYISMIDATTSLLNCRQRQEQSANNYLEALKSRSDTIKYHGGTLVLNPTLAPENMDGGTRYTDEERMKIARNCTLAAALIRGSDPTRYVTLVVDLANQYSKGKDQYPRDRTSVFSLQVNYRTPTNAMRSRNNNNSVNATCRASIARKIAPCMTFAQRTSVTPGTNGITYEGVACYRCNKTGHYAMDCPNDTGSTASGNTLMQYGFTLAQGMSGINHLWSCWTCSQQSPFSATLTCYPTFNQAIISWEQLQTPVIKTLPWFACSQSSERFGSTLTSLPTSSPSQKSARFAV